MRWPGVVAALVAHDHVHLAGEEVGELSLCPRRPTGSRPPRLRARVSPFARRFGLRTTLPLPFAPPRNAGPMRDPRTGRDGLQHAVHWHRPAGALRRERASNWNPSCKDLAARPRYGLMSPRRPPGPARSKGVRMKPRGLASSLTARALTVAALLAGVLAVIGAGAAASPAGATSPALTISPHQPELRQHHPRATSRCSPSSSPTRTRSTPTPSAPPPPSPAPIRTTSSASPEANCPNNGTEVVLAPNDTCTVDVVFFPGGLGVRSATITFNDTLGLRRLHLAQRYRDHRLLPGQLHREGGRASATPQPSATRPASP